MNRFSICAVLVIGVIASSPSVWADEAIVPGQGFVASRYEVLWTKSPFSVASATEPAASPEYSLTGLSQFDGVSYVNLFDKQKQEHFVLTSDNPVRGLKLVSIAHGQDPANSSAVIQRNGESITLKLEVQAASASVPIPVVNASPPPQMAGAPNLGAPQMQPPSAPNQGNPTALGPAQTPPPPLFHRHAITVPPRPAQ